MQNTLNNHNKNNNNNNSVIFFATLQKNRRFETNLKKSTATKFWEKKKRFCFSY